LPQHTSTRQSANTAGAADGEVLPPDIDTEPTPGGAIATRGGGRCRCRQLRGRRDRAGRGHRRHRHRSPEAEVNEKATATAPATGAEPGAPATDADTDTDTAAESVTDTGADTEAPADTDPDTPEQAAAPEAATPRPRRPGLRTWSSRLGLRRRMQAWREKHPAAARAVSWVVTLLGAVLVYVCLEMPNTLGSLRLMEFARLPAEAIMGAVVLISLPRRPRIIVAALSGALVGALAVLNMFDMGFNEYLGRHFNIILDWSLFGDARGYLRDTFGGTATQAITVGVIALIIVLVVLVALATVRLGNLLADHKTQATRGTLIAGTVWINLHRVRLPVLRRAARRGPHGRRPQVPGAGGAGDAPRRGGVQEGGQGRRLRQHPGQASC